MAILWQEYVVTAPELVVFKNVAIAAEWGLSVLFVGVAAILGFRVQKLGQQRYDLVDEKLVPWPTASA